MKRLTALVLLIVVLAACSRAVDTASEVDGAVQPSGEVTDEGGRGEDGDFGPIPPGSGDIDIVIGDRRVVRNASLQLHATNTRDVFDQIVILTESLGGFVASAEVLPTDGEDRQPQISVVLRVPAEGLTETMRSIKGLADDVVSESQNAQDVSEQFVDLEARLTNLEALETELRALLAEVRAQPDADPAKLLQVFNELASVRGQIEGIQGQLEYLTNLTDMATLQVGLTQTPAAVPVVDEPWAPAEAAREAARNLVSALQVMADWVIAFVIYTLPVLILALTLPVIVAVLVYRRWKGRGAPPAPAES